MVDFGDEYRILSSPVPVERAHSLQVAPIIIRWKGPMDDTENEEIISQLRQRICVGSTEPFGVGGTPL